MSKPPDLVDRVHEIIKRNLLIAAHQGYISEEEAQETHDAVNALVREERDRMLTGMQQHAELADELIRVKESFRLEMVRRAECEGRIEELEALFDLQHKRSIEAIELWQKAHPGNDLIHPDLGALLEWLMKLLKAHRRFHGKAGCPGGKDCYVCEIDP